MLSLHLELPTKGALHSCHAKSHLEVTTMSLHGTCALQATSHVSEVQLLGLSTFHGATALQDITFHGGYHIPWRAVQPLTGTTSLQLLLIALAPFAACVCFVFFLPRPAGGSKEFQRVPECGRAVTVEVALEQPPCTDQALRAAAFPCPSPQAAAAFERLLSFAWHGSDCQKLCGDSEQRGRSLQLAQLTAQGCTGAQHGRCVPLGEQFGVPPTEPPESAFSWRKHEFHD